MSDLDTNIAKVLHGAQSAEVAAQRLRVAIAAAGTTPTGVARALGFSTVSLQTWTITNLERQRQPRFTNLIMLAAYLQSTVTFLAKPEPYEMVSNSHSEPQSWRDYAKANRVIFAQRIRVAMAASGTNPAKIQRSSEVSRYAIDDWRKGRAAPNRDSLVKFSVATGAPMSWLSIPFPVSVK